MANPDHVAVVQGGPGQVAEWLLRCKSPGFDLSNADLRGVDFRQAALLGSDFRGTDLSGANLAGVDLRGAIFCRTELAKAEFTQAFCWGTVFADLDLSAAVGLDSIVHCGPSSIDVSTILRTAERLPRVFLRACGVIETAVDQVENVRICGESHELPSCFISYSDRDREFASLLYDRLNSEGIRCFYAPEHIRGGQPILGQLDHALRLHDRVVLVLSGSSLGSQWVKNEVIKARRRERREGNRILFPICIEALSILDHWEWIDPLTGEDIAMELRGYFIPDFSEWSDSVTFDAAMQRLLHDLEVTPLE